MNIWTKLAMFSFFETDRLYLRQILKIYNLFSQLRQVWKKVNMH